jgi:hypothetical protein
MRFERFLPKMANCQNYDFKMIFLIDMTRCFFVMLIMGTTS